MSLLAFPNTIVKSPGFGAMSLSGAWGPVGDEEGLEVLRKAFDLGSTFWDTASVYGFGHNERLIGRFLKENPGAREKLFIASKCGWEFDAAKRERIGLTNSAQHIKAYIDDTIERLGTTPDLYYLHRRDPNTPLEESITALAKLKAEGKCKYIGISEPSAKTLRAACAIAHIDAVQIEYSPFCLQPEKNGMLETCRELGVAVVAFSPLGAGFLTGKYTDPKQFTNDARGAAPRFQGEAFKENLKMLRSFEGIAADKGCTSSQLALAWVAKQGAIAIPGTKSTSRLEENWAAHTVALDDGDMSRIRECINVGVKGERWAPAIMAAVEQ